MDDDTLADRAVTSEEDIVGEQGQHCHGRRVHMNTGSAGITEDEWYRQWYTLVGNGGQWRAMVNNGIQWQSQ